MATCPVTSSQEWKELIEYAGSVRRAEQLYLAHNAINNTDEIPTIDQLQTKEIKQGIKEPEKIDRFAPLIEKNIDEIKRLDKILARKTSDFKKSTDKPKLSKDIQKLRNKIATIEEDNFNLKKRIGLESIDEYAKKDLDYVQDILDNYESKGISTNELSSVIKTITLWQQAGDFSKDHLFLTPEELEANGEGDNEILEEIFNTFSKNKRRADKLSNKYKNVAKSLLENEAHKRYGSSLKVELDKALKDVNFLFKNTIDISEIDSQIFSLMSDWVRKANWKAQNDVKEDFDELTTLFKPLKDKKKIPETIELFQQTQSNTDPRKTGNVTHRFTQAYHEKVNDIYFRLKSALSSSETTEDPVKKRKLQQKAYKDFRDSINDVSITLDVRKLFFDDELYNDYEALASDEVDGIKVDFTEQDRIDYIKELKDILGEEGYEYYMEETKNKLDMYKLDEQSQRDELEDTLGGDLAAVEIAMSEWKLKYNPFWNSHYSIEGHPSKKIGNSWASSSRQYISSIAKRSNEKGQDLGFYDAKFTQIMADSDMKNLYNFVMGALDEYSNFLPPHETKFWQVNTLPTLEKSIIESFTRDGLGSGLQSMFKQLQESTKTAVYTGEDPANINIIDKEVQVDFLSNNQSIISDYIIRKTIDYKNKNKEVSAEELRELKKEWRKDIQNELATNKSWDIEKILKSFMMHTSTFKHKTKIEDSMKLCRVIIDDLVEQQPTANDNPTSKLAEKLGWRAKDLGNIKDMTDHFLNNFFGYDIKSRTGESVREKEQKKRKYNKEEKETKVQLEESMNEAAILFNKGKIDEEEYTKRYNSLQNQLNKLGKIRSWINVADMIIKYVQVKGIGWNVFSAFSNRGFGIIANWIESADGRRFTQKQLREASAIMKHSLLKNVSFHTIDTNIAQKIKGAMSYLDVLKESKNEIFEQKLSNWNNKVKWLSPYNMQSRGEYMNQGEVMIAMMKNTPILLDGKESNLWEALDSDGNKVNEKASLPENSKFENVDDLVFDVKSKIDEAIRTLHGNYDYESAPLAGKRTVLGRALFQFRTWAMMGFYDRFGQTTDSDIAGFTKKGRYKSYGALFKEFGPMRATVEITKNLARKLMFSNTKFDEITGENFTEADAANLRKNLQEIVMYLTVTGLGLLLRAATVGDDDEEKDPTFLYLATFWINQMGRLQTDILFYTNPVEFEKLQRQALPIFNLVTDGSKLLLHGVNLLTGQTTDEYQTGIYSGQSKSWRYGRQVVPLLNQYNRLESVGKQLRK